MITKELQTSFSLAVAEAARRRHEYITLEHLLLALLENPDAKRVLIGCKVDLERLRADLESFLAESVETVAEDDDYLPAETAMFRRTLEYALMHIQSAGRKDLDGAHMLAAILHAEQSHAVYYLTQQGVSKLDVLTFISHGFTADQSMHAIPDAAEEHDPAAHRDPLEAFTTNLVTRAKAGEIDPLIGRSAEIERTIQILCRRRKNNPLFVGEPGVGKTAIAEGLALRIHENDVPPVLKGAEVYSLDMSAVLAGTKFRGDFEQRLKNVVQALMKKDNAILFIDEIHTIVGAGSVTGGSMDASNIIKPALASGKMRCIGSTTFAEYKASFERDRALARRFQKIEIGEPSVAETIDILKGLRKYYEEFHGVTFADDAIALAAELSAKYINDRHLPDKAIDVLDEAGARVRMMRTDTTSGPTLIGTLEIETVVSRMAKIPPRTIARNERERLGNLDGELRKVIFGQNEAIHSIVSAIKLSRSGLGNSERPVGSFLFSGPTGVGKTELAKQLAAVLGVEFIRFDMSEYMEPHTVSRLIGAPPGYVGFDQGGLLTDAITRTPYAVLVLDEIEKAHPNLFSILLQVMDHATLTDNNGKKADFRNVVVIMTTNAGGREMTDVTPGFFSSTETGRGRATIEKMFAPEFRNRLDAWISFAPLSQETVVRVVEKFLAEAQQQLSLKNVTLQATDEAKNWLATKGYDRRFGARPLERLIQVKVKEKLVDRILFGDLAEGGVATISVADGELHVS